MKIAQGGKPTSLEWLVMQDRRMIFWSVRFMVVFYLL